MLTFGFARANDKDFVDASSLFRFPTEFSFASCFGDSVGGVGWGGRGGGGSIVGNTSLFETWEFCN